MIAAGTVALVAVLTYLRARVTVLQPLRAEVFKLQLRAAESILSQFVGKSEHELRSETGVNEMIYLNSQVLLAWYYHSVGVQTSESLLSKIRGDIASSMVDVNWADREFTLAGLKDSDSGDVGADTAGPPREPAPFMDPRHCVAVPRPFEAWLKTLRRILGDPLLPAETVEQLKQIEAASLSMTSTIKQVSAELLDELEIADTPKLLNSRDFFNEFSNRANRTLPELEPLCSDLVQSIREAFSLDRHGELRRYR